MRFLRLAVAVLALCSWFRAGAATAGSDLQRNTLWRQASTADFRAWTAAGVAMSGSQASPAIELVARPGVRPACATAAIDGGRARFDAAAGFCAGSDPKPRGAYGHGGSYYNGGSFWFGTVTSPARYLPAFDHLIASWEADTPAGTWIEVHARLLEPGGWTRWYVLGVWARDSGTIHRHSVDHQTGAMAGVDTDTLHTASGRTATAYQIEVTLFTISTRAGPIVHSIAVVACHDGDRYPTVAGARTARGVDLPVPQRSQMAARYHGLAYGGGGEVWCSPTSTSMVMAYWAAVLHRSDLNQPVPAVAAGTYDATYDGTGNWPFNTAYAGSFGLTAYVTRMYSMNQAEAWIKARVPLVITIAFAAGELPGEPLGISDGHLIVVRGFTRGGDVVADDPGAATDAGVRIVYPRAALERVWQRASHGTAYVIFPPGWPVPRG